MKARQLQIRAERCMNKLIGQYDPSWDESNTLDLTELIKKVTCGENDQDGIGKYRPFQLIFRSVLHYTTGWLVIQNAEPLFCTTHLAKRNYWAELAQIWYGTNNGDNSRFNRGGFVNSVWGPRYGVSKGSRGQKIFCLIFLFISPGMDFQSFNSLVYAKISPSFNHFNVQGAWQVDFKWQFGEAGLLQKFTSPLKNLYLSVNFPFLGNSDIPCSIPTKQNEKIGKKNFGPPPGTSWVPYIEFPPDRISKNPSIKPRVIPIGGPIQNLSQFGPIVPSGEMCGTKKWLCIL